MLSEGGDSNNRRGWRWRHSNETRYHPGRSHNTKSTPRTSRRCNQPFIRSEALLLKCDKEDPMTEVIVSKIVTAAKTGEHDTDRLAVLVLNDLVDDGA
jgi:hypothetical protein